MKIITLKIHNIASIADAFIDFAEPPLSDADIFLITGNTGAGKSTILDCICLALFNTAPRLKSTLMEGRIEQKGDYNGIALSDPRQLLRRNTGEGFAELVFEGSNGLLYTARWSAQRAYCKPQGRLQKIVHTYTCGARVFTGDTLREERQRAVGMNYEEFVRTTMLAQGEFTRFLNCSDKEKADVLMQILDVRTYEKISRRIHLRTSSEKEKLERLRLRADSLDLLSPEQYSALTEEKSVLTARTAELRSALDALELKARWFANFESVCTRLSVAEMKLVKATAAYESPQIVSCIAFLEAYDSASALLSMLREAFAKLKALRNSKLRSIELAEEYLRQSTRLSLLEVQVADIEKDVLQNQCWFSDNEAFAYTTERHLIVEQAAKNYYTAALRRRTNESRLTELLRELDISLSEQKKALEGASKAEEKVVAEKQLYTRTDALLKEKNPEALQAKDSEIAERAAALSFAASLSQLRLQRQAEYAQAVSQLNDLKAALPDDLRAVEAAEADVATHQAVLDSNIKIFEKASQSMSDWCRRIRSELSVGDTCPVCSRRIESALGSDDDIMRTLEPLRIAVEEARQAHTLSIGRLNDARVALESRRKLILSAEGQAERCRKASDDANAQLEAQCSALAVSADGIEKALEACAEMRNKLRPLLAEARELRVQVENQRSKVDAAVAAKEAADALVKRVAESIAALDARKASLDALISSEGSRMKDLSSLLDTEVRGPWKSLWRDDLHGFLEELAAAVAARKDAESKRDSLARTREKLASSVAICREASDAILTRCPNLNDIPVRAPENPEMRAVGRLDVEFPALKARIEANLDSIKALEEQLAVLKLSIKEKIAGGQEKSILALCRMLRISPEEIQTMRAGLGNAESALAEARGACDTLRREHKSLLDARPDIEEGENASTVADTLNKISSEAEVCAGRIAVIEASFRRDRELRDRQAGILAEVEAQKNVLDAWARLDRHFGSADGRQFSKIALRYVLGHLLEKANVYLQRIMPRYRLHCRRDSFIIMLEDAYQNGAMRSANVISGGESFIVSLVLALALSDVGTKLKVDILFIDEGFGSLSGDALESAVDTLRSLHARGGRRVGIISHVAELRERIPVKICVRKEGQAPSTVEISG